MLSSKFVLLLSLVALPLVAAHTKNSRHSEAVKRRSPSLAKRDFSGQFTYYADNTDEGACGGWNKPGDFIVALNAQQFDGGKYCGETVSITIDGKTQQATIVDECMGCGFGGLDFSSGLFSSFADLGVGELHGSWSFGSSGGSGGDETTSSKTTHTSTTQQKTSTQPTTTWKPTSTSTTHSTTHTTSTHHTTSTPSTTSSKPSSTKSSTSSTASSTSTSASASASINYNSGEAGGLAQATGSLSGGTASNLADLNQAFVGLAALFVAASEEN